MKRFGVIDLGTNTFHLLISDYMEREDSFVQIFKKRETVKLGEKGLGKINEKAFQRGLNAVKSFKKIAKKYHVDKLVAIGTAALRRASNGKNFIKTVKEETGIDIELITGAKEAELIHLGISSVIPIGKSKELIMDIGGGSIEFIICNDKKVYWSKSFPIGLSILVEKIHFSEPVKKEELKAFDNFLTTELSELIAQLKKYPVKNIIGSSGVFDVIEQNIVPKKINGQYAVMEINDFFTWYDRIIPTTYEERLNMPEIPESRADLVVYAFALINFIIKKTAIKKITASPYALKEGTLIELARKEKQLQ